MSFKQATILIAWIGIAIHTQAQDQIQRLVDSLPTEVVSDKYLDVVSNKADQLESKLEAKSAKALSIFQKQESSILKKLSKLDSIKADKIFSNGQQQYVALEKKLQNTHLRQYLPSFDSISTSLKFLEQNPQFLSEAKDTKEKLQQALKNVNGMGNQLQKAEDIKKFIRERKQYLKEQLKELGFAKELKRLNKHVYYYSQQLNDYKELWKDHKKAERKALELLSKTKVFKDFMRKNSMLASLFRLPGDPNDPLSQVNLAGLQTRSQVTSLIQSRVATGGANAQQQIQQGIQQAQGKLNELKNRLNQFGQSSSDAEMPEGFKANSQKTRSFFKRLEFGANIQSRKPNGYFPVTSDIGLSLGYKLNDKSVFGVGASYKLGWGQNIHHIEITHQGFGLRSFIDWKIKGTFWLSGGYESNYNTEFENMEELKNLNAWQQSGLVGLSKVVSLKTKVLKKTKIQLLWDFLSYKQAPRTQPIIFRIGYNF